MFKNIFSVALFRLSIKNSYNWFLLTWPILTMFFCSCSSRGDNSESSGERAKVVVSIPPLLYFAEAIGGDSIVAVSLTQDSSDPETFQPGMSTMRSLAKCHLFVTVGILPFENALLGNLKANNRNLHVREMAEGIGLIYGTHSHECDGHGFGHAEEHEGHAHEPDPHVWSSVANAHIIAGNMLSALSEANPSAKEYFKARHKQLVARLDSLDRVFSETLDALPSRGFAVWHPSLSYFARDYNLDQIAFNIENKETSSLQLRRRIDEANAERLSAFIVPLDVELSQVEAIARSIGVKPVKVNLMSADWERQMVALVKAFKTQPTTPAQ